jgi:uncharacterized protein (TIGR02271 family)
MAQDSISFTDDISSLVGYEVIDRNNKKIGKVKDVWQDADGQPVFIAIKSGWLGMGRSHFVPAHLVEASEKSHTLRLPYDEDSLKNAPEFDAESDIDPASENRIYEYYRGLGVSFPEARQADWSTAPESGRADTEARETLKENLKEARDTAKEKAMKLKGEKIQVGKRTEEAGGVRIRKVVRTEIVNQPVELEREEVVIERVPASSTGPVEASFTGEEVFIPLRRERAEITKTAEVIGEVRARKKAEKDKETISETVRKEDIEVEDERKGV